MEAGEKNMELLNDRYEEFNEETEQLLSSKDSLIKLQNLISCMSIYKQSIAYITYIDKNNSDYGNITEEKLKSIIDEDTSSSVFTLNIIIAEIDRLKELNSLGSLPKIDKINESIITPLICDEKYLMRLYADYDGKMWESVPIETFLDYMRDEPIGQIKPIPMIKDFGIWIRKNIELNRSKGMAKNINNWYMKLMKTKTKLSDIAPVS